MNLRQLLYSVARFLGDVNAIQKGKLLQRVVRKALLRKAGSNISRWIR